MLWFFLALATVGPGRIFVISYFRWLRKNCPYSHDFCSF